MKVDKTVCALFFSGQYSLLIRHTYLDLAEVKEVGVDG